MQRRTLFRCTTLLLWLASLLILISCEAAEQDSCPVTKPVWAQPPEDSAVGGASAYGYYFVNEDQSIWASSSWTEQEHSYLIADEEGIKTGWFRPDGAELMITGKRLDGESSSLFEASIPCCYPTKFQVAGLYFPTAGCWEITATAADKALTFVLLLEPDPQ